MAVMSCYCDIYHNLTKETTSHHLWHIMFVENKSQSLPAIKRRGLYKDMTCWEVTGECICHILFCV